jgi:hypothetical protein
VDDLGKDAADPTKRMLIDFIVTRKDGYRGGHIVYKSCHIEYRGGHIAYSGGLLRSEVGIDKKCNFYFFKFASYLHLGKKNEYIQYTLSLFQEVPTAPTADMTSFLSRHVTLTLQLSKR